MIKLLSLVCLIVIGSSFNSVHADYDCQFKTDGFYSDLEFCHIYWRCNYGMSEEYECPAGTAWNHKEGRCDWLENVDCTRDGTLEITEEPTTTETTTTEEPDLPEQVPDEFADVTDINGAVVFSTTPTEGLVDVTDASETTSGKSVCQSFGSYFVEDETNCGSYYLCQNGKESKMSCPEKQLFNLETSLCADFQTVFCGMRPVNFADKNQCLSKRDGIYPDVERGCQVFFQCIKQEKVREASCPVPLKFNAITGRCDNPLNILAPCGTYNPNLNNASTLFSWSKMFTAVLALAVGKFLMA